MIKSEKEYNAIVARVEQLLSSSENIDNPEAKGFKPDSLNLVDSI